MFDRKIESFHDKQTIQTSDFTDDFSTRYLAKVLNIKIPMRVKERSTPILPNHTGAIGGSSRNFDKRDEVI